MDVQVIVWILALALAAGVAFLVYHRLTPSTTLAPGAAPSPAAASKTVLLGGKPVQWLP
jgi:hypothetical protein